MLRQSLLGAITAILAAVPSAQAGLYTKNSPVLQVDAKSYKSLIANSNHTSIVEFYAPWCGHCKNLKPAYEKVAKQLEGLAKVAAVDCDDDANKAFCGSMGVQGFPTLKIVRPGKNPGSKPIVEDYNGQRTASAIAEQLSKSINNHVVKLSQTELPAFLNRDGVRAILLTEKGATSALIRSVAIDFLGSISVGQLRIKDKKQLEQIQKLVPIEKLPALVVLPDRQTSPAFYQGEMNKKGIVEFLKNWAEPNPDPAPPSQKKDDKKTKDKKQAKKDKQEEPEKAAEPEGSPESEEPSATAQAAAPALIPIATVTSYDTLAKACLQPQSHSCILAFVPAEATNDGEAIVASLTQLNTKYVHGKRHTFPFLSVPSDVDGAAALKKALGLDKDVEMAAINARRKWMRVYSGDFSETSVESWIDAVRMGDAKKDKLPSEIITEVAAEEEEKTAEESSSTEATQATDPEPEIETEAPESHDEL